MKKASFCRLNKTRACLQTYRMGVHFEQQHPFISTFSLFSRVNPGGFSRASQHKHYTPELATATTGRANKNSQCWQCVYASPSPSPPFPPPLSFLTTTSSLHWLCLIALSYFSTLQRLSLLSSISAHRLLKLVLNRSFHKFTLPCFVSPSSQPLGVCVCVWVCVCVGTSSISNCHREIVKSRFRAAIRPSQLGKSCIFLPKPRVLETN